MKYIIDTEKLSDYMNEIPLDKREGILVMKMRQLCQKVNNVPWAKEYKPTKKKVPDCPTEYTTMFEVFWQAWPKSRRTAKKAAFKSWWKAQHTCLPVDHLLQKCLGTLQWQTKEEQWTKDEGKYIPMPATWLNNERWNDEDPNDGREWEDYLAEDGSVKQRRVE